MRRYSLEVGEARYVIDVDEVTADRYRVRVGEQEFEVRLAEDEELAEAQITPAMLPSRSGPAPAPSLPRPNGPAPASRPNDPP
ncbi:MAG: acetyl-CoA carboxylase biotin carboxyl carrier protein subunit, partial [Candidatus Methylomirabilota bacterium]